MRCLTGLPFSLPAFWPTEEWDACFLSSGLGDSLRERVGDLLSSLVKDSEELLVIVQEILRTCDSGSVRQQGQHILEYTIYVVTYTIFGEKGKPVVEKKATKPDTCKYASWSVDQALCYILLVRGPSILLVRRPSILLVRRHSTLLVRRHSTLLVRRPSTSPVRRHMSLLVRRPSILLVRRPSILLVRRPSILLVRRPSILLVRRHIAPSLVNPRTKNHLSPETAYTKPAGTPRANPQRPTERSPKSRAEKKNKNNMCSTERSANSNKSEVLPWSTSVDMSVVNPNTFFRLLRFLWKTSILPALQKRIETESNLNNWVMDLATKSTQRAPAWAATPHLPVEYMHSKANHLSSTPTVHIQEKKTAANDVCAPNLQSVAYSLWPNLRIGGANLHSQSPPTLVCRYRSQCPQTLAPCSSETKSPMANNACWLPYYRRKLRGQYHRVSGWTWRRQLPSLGEIHGCYSTKQRIYVAKLEPTPKKTNVFRKKKALARRTFKQRPKQRPFFVSPKEPQDTPMFSLSVDQLNVTSLSPTGWTTSHCVSASGATLRFHGATHCVCQWLLLVWLLDRGRCDFLGLLRTLCRSSYLALGCLTFGCLRKTSSWPLESCSCARLSRSFLLSRILLWPILWRHSWYLRLYAWSWPLHSRDRSILWWATPFLHRLLRWIGFQLFLVMGFC